MSCAVEVGVMPAELDPEGRQWRLDDLRACRTLLADREIELDLDLASDTHEDLGDILADDVATLVQLLASTELVARRPSVVAHLEVLAGPAILLPVDIEEVVEDPGLPAPLASTVRLQEVTDALEALDLDPANPATETIELFANAASTSVAERLPVFITG